ncbi:MAG: hypothetical protein ACOYEG_00395 [Petrimonas sp.]
MFDSRDAEKNLPESAIVSLKKPNSGFHPGINAQTTKANEN